MKSQYVDLIKTIKARTQEWEKLLDQRWINVEHAFLESYNHEDHHTLADTEAFWQYRHAKIRWYLPSMIRLSEAEMDEAIVHEYVHVLLSPIEGKLASRHEELSEFTVESLAR